MKKALYQSKRCVNSKSLVSLGVDGYNSGLSKNIFEQNIKSYSSSSLIPPLYNIENKIIQTGNKFDQSYELKEEIEDEIEELNPKTWGRTIIVFNRHNPKHLKNQYRLKIKEKYVYKNDEQIESLPSCNNKEATQDCQIEPGHGKISIVFKHSGKGKKTKTEIIKKVLIPKKETQILKIDNEIKSEITSKFLDKCAPILETAKILKNKESDEFVGKVNIVFNRSNKYKNKIKNQDNSTLDDMRKDLENLNQITYLNDTDPKKCQITKIGDLTETVPKITPLKNGFKNKSLDKGKIHVVFNPAIKTKRLKQLRKHFAPQISKINQMKKMIDKKNEKSKKLAENSIVETDENILIDEIVMDLNEVNNQSNERSKILNKVKISVTQPRTDEKLKSIPSNITLLESSEWFNKEAELEKLNNLVDKNQKQALKNAMTTMSLQKTKKKPKIWKSSATRIIMEKTKQNLDRLIMMNSDPQCGFISGIPDMSRSMSVLKDIAEKNNKKETTVQTFVFEEPALNSENKTELSKNSKSFEDDVPNINDTCVPDYIKMVGTDKFTLEIDNDEYLKPNENVLQFNKFLSDPSEIGSVSINSTRTGETLENDRVNKKLNLNIGDIKPLENVKEIGRKLKSESIKESSTNHGFINEDDSIDTNFHNSWYAFDPNPLELKLFLKVVTNLFENVNHEIIDDLVSFSAVNNAQNTTMKKVTKESNETKTETRDQLYEILKNQSTENTSIDVSKINECLEITPVKKINETIKVNNDTLKKSVTPISINVTEDKEIKENPKTKRTSLANVKNYFETLRTEAKITVSEAISRNLAKERMKVYKEFSQKFEKMGLYKKQPKKLLIEDLKEGIKEESKKKPTYIKRDIELQEKFKNTPEGIKLQEYFDSFRFKLTTSMKEEPKRKISQEKKLIISSKLGSLNPATSPSQPSFTRRNNK